MWECHLSTNWSIVVNYFTIWSNVHLIPTSICLLINVYLTHYWLSYIIVVMHNIHDIGPTNPDKHTDVCYQMYILPASQSVKQLLPCRQLCCWLKLRNVVYKKHTSQGKMKQNSLNDVYLLHFTVVPTWDLDFATQFAIPRVTTCDEFTSSRTGRTNIWAVIYLMCGRVRGV